MFFVRRFRATPQSTPGGRARPGSRYVAVALAGVVPLLASPDAAACPDPTLNFSDNVPLDDLGSDTYLGEMGGLYPGGSNERPLEHDEAGVEQAALVVPRNAAGEPDDAGVIGMMSVGMSNTHGAFEGFLDTIAGDASIATDLVLVDGGIGGQGAQLWAQANHNAWTILDERVAAAGLTNAQVQVAWMKHQVNGDMIAEFPGGAADLRDILGEIVRVAKQRFPNLRLVYFSSRTYGHYSGDERGQSAYETGWSVKWLVEDQIDGDPDLAFEGDDAPAPWISWGPYLWADGEGPDQVAGGVPGRSDGLEWNCADYSNDGVHPSQSGRLKSGGMLAEFFAGDSTTTCWYLEDGDPCAADSPGGTDDGGDSGDDGDSGDSDGGPSDGDDTGGDTGGGGSDGGDPSTSSAGQTSDSDGPAGDGSDDGGDGTAGSDPMAADDEAQGCACRAGPSRGRQAPLALLGLLLLASMRCGRRGRSSWRSRGAR